MPDDLIAGLVLAAIALPEQIATARLAHMPAQTGLYAFLAGTLAFVFFGRNRYVSVGADSTNAPVFAGGIAALAAVGSAHYETLVTLTALLTGAMLVLAGMLRAGWIADTLSRPVITGFLAGIAVHIVTGQLPLILGIPEPVGTVVQRLVAIARELPAANALTLVLGAGVLIVALACRINERLPGALIGMVLATIAVAVFRLSQHGVAVLGALPSGFPPLRVPAGARDILALLPIAFIVAVVCIVQTSTVLRAFPSNEGHEKNVSEDFAAVGLGSILAGFVGAFAVNASPPRTAAVVASRARSQLAGVAAMLIVAAILLFGTGLASNLPLAALGGVLIFIAIRIFWLGEMARIARYGGAEIWLVVAGALLVVLLPIEIGMLLSIALSLVQGIYVIARPPCTEFEHIPGTTIWWPPSADQATERVPGVVVFAPAAPITFSNAHFILRRLRAAVQRESSVDLIVIEGGGVIDFDYTGSEALLKAILEFRSRRIDVALARLSDARAQAAAERSGIIEELGQDHVFRSVHEAVTALHDAQPYERTAR